MEEAGVNDLMAVRLVLSSEQEQECLIQLHHGELHDVERKIHQKAAASVTAKLLRQTLANPQFRQKCRILAGEAGYQIHSYSSLEVTLCGGKHVTVTSPYFTKAQHQGRRKHKKGPRRTDAGRHVGLEVLGFMDRTSPYLAFHALSLSALAPSFAVASRILQAEGHGICPDKLRRFAGIFDVFSVEERSRHSTAPDESVAGKRVVVAVDGGRARERRSKSGAIANDQKRRGYHTKWKEPRLLTIACLNDEGDLDKTFSTQVDAVFGLKRLIASVEAYLVTLQIDLAAEVILVGDGAKWIWNHLPGLLRKLHIHPDRITEVIDYTHAKQNLNQLIETFLKPCTTHHETKIRWQRMNDLLYHGKLDDLQQLLIEHTSKGQKRAMKKKLKTYFLVNRHRMQYASFEQRKIVRGSGIVESAIRRVINLRVKAPGSFWVLRKAETICFLRAKLLFGRWNLLIRAWKRDLKDQFQAISLPAIQTKQTSTLKHHAA